MNSERIIHYVHYYHRKNPSFFFTIQTLHRIKISCIFESTHVFHPYRKKKIIFSTSEHFVLVASIPKSRLLILNFCSVWMTILVIYPFAQVHYDAVTNYRRRHFLWNLFHQFHSIFQLKYFISFGVIRSFAYQKIHKLKRRVMKNSVMMFESMKRQERFVAFTKLKNILHLGMHRKGHVIASLLHSVWACTLKELNDPLFAGGGRWHEPLKGNNTRISCIAFNHIYFVRQIQCIFDSNGHCKSLRMTPRPMEQMVARGRQNFDPPHSGCICSSTFESIAQFRMRIQSPKLSWRGL